jgi:RNA polymerase sigma-70 factor (ECF subfamily)
LVDIERNLVEIIPAMRAYARVLCRSSVRADDLVQDALERALRHREQFIPGSSLKAWVFKILKNKFTDDLRASRHLVQDVGGENATRLVSLPDQLWRLQYADLLRAVGVLSLETQQAVLLTMGAGLTHEEAAVVCGCPLGTLKSRIRRARSHLLATVDIGAE